MFKSESSLRRLIATICVAVFITAYAIVNIGAINSGIAKFFKILTPFFIGFGIAYVLNRPISYIATKFKVKRVITVMIVYILLLALIATFSAFVLPTVINSSISLGYEVSKGVTTLVSRVESTDMGALSKVIDANINKIAEFLTGASNFIIVNLSSIFATITATFMNIFFGIIISIYMLLDKEKIAKLFKRVTLILFGADKGEGIIEYFAKANVVFSHFITGLIVESLIVGSLAFIFFKLFGVRYAVILAIIITFTNVIPYVGPFIGAIPAITATLLYDPTKAIWVALFIALLQQVDANLIGPRVMGNYIGLEPIWIILSITIGGGFFGVLGILLAIPTGAIIKILLSRSLSYYNDTHGNV